jgi:hypothetical protein
MIKYILFVAALFINGQSHASQLWLEAGRALSGSPLFSGHKLSQKICGTKNSKPKDFTSELREELKKREVLFFENNSAFLIRPTPNAARLNQIAHLVQVQFGAKTIINLNDPGLCTRGAGVDPIGQTLLLGHFAFRDLESLYVHELRHFVQGSPAGNNNRESLFMASIRTESSSTSRDDRLASYQDGFHLSEIDAYAHQIDWLIRNTDESSEDRRSYEKSSLKTLDAMIEKALDATKVFLSELTDCLSQKIEKQSCELQIHLPSPSNQGAYQISVHDQRASSLLTIDVFSYKPHTTQTHPQLNHEQNQTLDLLKIAVPRAQTLRANLLRLQPIYQQMLFADPVWKLELNAEAMSLIKKMGSI